MKLDKHKLKATSRWKKKNGILNQKHSANEENSSTCIKPQKELKEIDAHSISDIDQQTDELLDLIRDADKVYKPTEHFQLRDEVKIERELQNIHEVVQLDFDRLSECLNELKLKELLFVDGLCDGMELNDNEMAFFDQTVKQIMDEKRPELNSLKHAKNIDTPSLLGDIANVIALAKKQNEESNSKISTIQKQVSEPSHITVKKNLEAEEWLDDLLL